MSALRHHGRRVVGAALVLCAGGCASQMARTGVTRVPEQRSIAARDVRGTDAASSTFSVGDEVAIYKALVHGFYRPTGGQVRWIDPQRLSHRRMPAADSAEVAEPELAATIVGAVGLLRVCRRGDAATACAGRDGGVLRFSAPYATGQDSAAVFVRYAPTRGTGPELAGLAWEIEFHLARDDRGWRVVNRLNVDAAGDSRAP